MKKLLMLLVAGVLMGSVVYAQKTYYHLDPCIPKAAVFGIMDEGELFGPDTPGWVVPINLTSYSLSTGPTSSIIWPFANSSGTSGCSFDEETSAYIEQHHFVAVTIDNLSEQIAQGGGPHLQSLSILLGCPASAYSILATITRQNYDELFPSVETEPEVFLTRLKGKMRAYPRLAVTCVYI